MIWGTKGVENHEKNFIDPFFLFFHKHLEVGLLHYMIHSPREVRRVSNREASKPLVKILASWCSMGTCLSSITLSSTRL